MNYERVYRALISFRTSNPPKGYCERHHILPKSLGGTDVPENLVALTAREHFIAHLLLTKIYKSGPNHYKMVKALNMMMTVSKNQQRYIPSRIYELVRKEFSTAQSFCQSGVKNSQFGTVWVFHILVGRKKVKSSMVPELIEQGWFLGKTLKVCKVKMTNEQRRQNNKNKVALKYPELDAWYDLYAKIGFDEFVKRTGYNHSKPNLVNLFRRHVKNFKPQNGKRRKSY